MHFTKVMFAKPILEMYLHAENWISSSYMKDVSIVTCLVKNVNCSYDIIQCFIGNGFEYCTYFEFLIHVKDHYSIFLMRILQYNELNLQKDCLWLKCWLKFEAV